MPQSKYSTVLQNYAKSQKNAEKDGGDNNGSGTWIRTRDQVVNSHLLYR